MIIVKNVIPALLTPGSLLQGQKVKLKSEKAEDREIILLKLIFFFILYADS